MLPTLTPIAHLYGVNDVMIDRCVGDFLPDDYLVRNPSGHDARWITGHVTVYRKRLVTMMGLTARSDHWDEVFQKGTVPDAVPAALDGGLIVRAFHDAHQTMMPRWGSLTESDLNKPLGRNLPDGGDTIGAGLRFLLWHETYHLGQLGMLRRLAGKLGIV